VSDWYNAISNSYDELYGEEQSLKHKTIMQLIGHEKFGVLVDVGCGPGNLLRDLRESCDYAVGIDLSKDMLRTAKKRRGDKTDLVLATSRMLPLKDQTVDCTTSVSTIKADSNLPQILDELTRISRRGAILALGFFCKPESITPPLLSHAQNVSRVSDRETVYYLRLNR